MNIFAFFRKQQTKRADWLMPIDLPHYPETDTAPRIFEATHMHVGTGGLYMLTAIGERLEVTGDDAYPLAEYENADGECFAQRADRFNDGRFRELAW